MSAKDDRLLLVINVIGMIEKSIERKETSSKIKLDVIKETNYSERHVDRIFKGVMGCSLDEFIKDLYFIRVYKIWRKDGKVLKQRETYEGIPYFPIYFERRYGFSIYEAHEKGEIMLNTYVTQEELKQMKDCLDKSKIVEKYEIKEGKVTMELDENLLMLTILCCKNYTIPARLVKEANWNELSLDSRKLLLILINRMEVSDAILEGIQEISIKGEELECEYEQLALYDMENPTLINGIYVYSVKLEDNFKPLFERMIDSCLHLVSLTFVDGNNIPLKYTEIIDGITKCNGLVSVRRIAEKTKKTEEQVVNVLWDMTKEGILRLKVE